MVTIKDVAREAGVSTATVSRAINDSPLVRPMTREHVRLVAERLNYLPNGVARSLITNRTHTLGVFLPELHGEFFSGVLRGIDLAARRCGRHLLISSSHADSEELIATLRSMRGRIDGLIVMAPDLDSPDSIRSTAGNIPIVLLDPGSGVDGYDTISIANFDGAYAAVQHLLRLGHRRIATITGPEHNSDGSERLGGYRAAVQEGGGDLSDDLIARGDFSERSGHRAMTELLRLERRPAAVFVGNDYMAVGALRAIADADLRVPDDVALVGFDDIEVSSYLDPPLTTVRVDTFELGERSVQRLLGVGPADGQGKRQHHEILPTTLVIRRSCGAEGLTNSN